MNRTRGIYLSLQGSLLLICCALLLGAASRPSALVTNLVNKSKGKGSVQVQPRVVVSDGLKLEILDIKLHPNDVIEVTMKNGYKRDITAIAASAGDGQSFHTDYIYAESEAFQKLAPGASDIFLYTPMRRLGVVPQIIVSAAVFGDGITKGDPSKASYILDKRKGMKFQLNRVIPYLETLGKVKGPLIRSELRKLRSFAEGLAIDKSDGPPLSPGFEYGLTHGRAFILKYLSKLETALENERIGTLYQDGLPNTVRHSREEEFQSTLPIIQKDFKGLATRL